MAYKEILKIDPQLDSGNLGKMEKTLTERFANVAKKFGKGIIATITGGGVIGAVTLILNKLLNPLKDTQEAIDKTLKMSNDLVTNAQQFDTTAGKLFKLSKIAQSTGLDQETLFTMLTKFQSAVAQTKADPSQPSAVRNFTDQTDTVEAFFAFIQGLQKMTKDQQVLVENNVFGERLAPRAYSFFNTQGLGARQDALGLYGEDTYTKAAKRGSAFQDETDFLDAKRDAKDLLTKANEITEGMIKAKAAQDDRALSAENERITNYAQYAKLQIAADKIALLMDEGLAQISKIVTSSTTLNQFIINFSASRFYRGLIGKITGQGDK